MHQYRTHAAYFNLWLRLDQVVYMPSYNLNHVRSVRSVVERRGIVSSRFFPSNNHRKRYNHRNKLQIQFRLIETCGNIVKYLFKLPQKQTDKKKKKETYVRDHSAFQISLHLATIRAAASHCSYIFFLYRQATTLDTLFRFTIECQGRTGVRVRHHTTVISGRGRGVNGDSRHPFVEPSAEPSPGWAS